jgi:hypothetical protein
MAEFIGFEAYRKHQYNPVCRIFCQLKINNNYSELGRQDEGQRRRR